MPMIKGEVEAPFCDKVGILLARNKAADCLRLLLDLETKLPDDDLVILLERDDAFCHKRPLSMTH